MEEIIYNIIMDFKENKISSEKAINHLMSLSNVNGPLPIEFAEWIGTNYEQDNGSVLGNVYYDRVTRKDYSVSELWDLFIKPIDLSL
jgi:hypothetical protein